MTQVPALFKLFPFLQHQRAPGHRLLDKNGDVNFPHRYL